MNIVFDFGGVLFRWQPHAFMQRLLPQRCATPQAASEFVAQFFQGFEGDWGEFDRGTLDRASLAERIARRVGLAVHEAKRVIDAVPDELQPLPESVALLRRLHASGRHLYFLSNMPEPYAQHLEATHDFLGLFRGGVFSSRAGLIKPDPAIFEHAQMTFGTHGATMLFIDDVEKNVMAARAAGWQAIQFHDAAQCERELVALGLI